MLTTVKNIKYLLYMDNCFVKACKSYEKSYDLNLRKKFCESPPSVIQTPVRGPFRNCKMVKFVRENLLLATNKYIFFEKNITF